MRRQRDAEAVWRSGCGFRQPRRDHARDGPGRGLNQGSSAATPTTTRHPSHATGTRRMQGCRATHAGAVCVKGCGSGRARPGSYLRPPRMRPCPAAL